MSGWYPQAQPSSSRICLFPFPAFLELPPHRKHELGVYLSGALFAMGWWIFANAVIQAKIYDVPINAEWAPGFCLTFGMLVVNSIDQARLVGDTFGSGGGGSGHDEETWKVRLAFFVGVAIMVGGFAGSIILVIVKYVNTGLDPTTGWAIVIQCAAIILSSATLWVAQNAEGDYHIALSSM